MVFDVKKYAKTYNKEWRKKNPEKFKAQKKRYREKNKEKIRISKRLYRLKNIHKYRIYSKRWNLKNKDKIKDRSKKKYGSIPRWCIPEGIKECRLRNIDQIRKHDRMRVKKKRLEDKGYAISKNLSFSMRQALKKNKNGQHWETIIGYSTNDLKQHLEKQFTRRMKWSNYGKYWHIDHRIPISCFKFISYEDKQFQECWALDNLQPLEAKKNISKRNRYSEPTLNQILKKEAQK